jgi:hypothetical protein
MHVLGDNNEAINKWLAENPMILGGAALVLGLILVGLGVRALVSGQAPTKRGPDLEGDNAKAMAFVWLGFGALCVLFGLYKVVSGPH